MFNPLVHYHYEKSAAVIGSVNSNRQVQQRKTPFSLDGNM